MTGGLGNQMFIYAFYLSMKRRFPSTRIDLSDMAYYNVHNGYEMHRVFGLPHTEFCTKRWLKKIIEFLFFKTILERKQPEGNSAPYERRYFWPWIYFKGFFQSENFFADVVDDVRRAFTFSADKANERTRRLLTEIAACPSVSLHVRRGDYLQPKHFASVGGVCGADYYRNAVAEVQRRVRGARFFVFSDDMDWVRQNIALPPNSLFVDWNKAEESWQDMFLMSACQHHVISNSTFSWWGAWLGSFKNKLVLAPRIWFKHKATPYIYSQDWVMVDVE